MGPPSARWRNLPGRAAAAVRPAAPRSHQTSWPAPASAPAPADECKTFWSACWLTFQPARARGRAGRGVLGGGCRTDAAGTAAGTQGAVSGNGMYPPRRRRGAKAKAWHSCTISATVAPKAELHQPEAQHTKTKGHRKDDDRKRTGKGSVNPPASPAAWRNPAALAASCAACW